MGLFLILAMVFIIEKCKKLKKVAVAILWTGAIYGVGTLLNILLSKTLWNSSRVLGGGDLIGTIESFGNNFSEVFINYCHMVPAWAPILAIGCIAMIALLYCAKDKMIKKFIFALFKSMLVIIVSIIAAATPQIVNMNGFAPEPRLLYPYGAIIGGVGLLIVNPVRLGRWGRVLIVSVIVFFLGIELYSFNGLEISNYIKDAVDADRSRIIQDHINSYEKLSNIVVTRISPIKDSVPTYAYPETHFYGDINITSFATSWSDVASINYYNQKGYIRVNADNQEMNNYCKGKNWDAFSEEQMIFDSNIPADVLIVIKKMLQKNPADRCSASEAWEAFGNVGAVDRNSNVSTKARTSSSLSDKAPTDRKAGAKESDNTGPVLKVRMKSSSGASVHSKIIKTAGGDKCEPDKGHTFFRPSEFD